MFQVTRAGNLPRGHGYDLMELHQGGGALRERETKMADESTGRSADEIASDIEEWGSTEGANGQDADALAKILAEVTRMLGNRDDRDAILAHIDSETAP